MRFDGRNLINGSGHWQDFLSIFLKYRSHRFSDEVVPSPPGFPGSSQAQSLLRYSLNETEVVQDSPQSMSDLPTIVICQIK